MTTLADRLKSLGVRLGADDLNQPPPPRNAHAIEAILPGRFVPTPFGDLFVTETVYPSGHRHGQASLELGASLRTVAQWAREERVADLPPDGFLFLDTETSGLAGGTGTYAFLVGLGQHQADGFHLTQAFMRDPAEEPALLHFVAGYLSSCRSLVTFNGKSFDMPLLATRYALQRSSLPSEGAAHVDLLPLARRLWRNRLESRALSFLEVHILGHERDEEEVPGWLVPQLYFDYLRTGDAGPLKGVFYHNAMDVVALAALFSHVTGLLEDPLEGGREHGEDLVALGRLFEDLGQPERAVELYRSGLEMPLPDEVFVDGVRRLSFLMRRQAGSVAAAELWRTAAGGDQIYAHEALAKFYEHEVRDYAQAHACTEAALLIARAAPPGPAAERAVQELEHRLGRLERKIRGGVAGAEDAGDGARVGP